MAEITASTVKELRDRTGAGMMEAKKALIESGGDIEAAIKHLRESGALKAEKKSARATSEGRVGGFVDKEAAALVEVLCETDFVAKNNQFVAFAAAAAESVAKASGVEDPDAIPFITGGTLGEALKSQIATIGENIKLGKVTRLTGADSVFGLYIHNNGKIGVVTRLTGAASAAAVAAAKDVAMHVAFEGSSKDLFMTRDQVPAAKLETERDVYRKQTLAEGKPANIVDKIVEGKLNAFFKSCVLPEQPFVKDPKKTVSQTVKEAGGAVLADFAMVSIG